MRRRRSKNNLFTSEFHQIFTFFFILLQNQALTTSHRCKFPRFSVSRLADGPSKLVWLNPVVGFLNGAVSRRCSFAFGDLFRGLFIFMFGVFSKFEKINGTRGVCLGICRLKCVWVCLFSIIIVWFMKSWGLMSLSVKEDFVYSNVKIYIVLFLKYQ